MKDCIFCNMPEMKKQGILYQDKYCYAILEKYPGQRGETLVITKEHYKDILDAPEDVVAHMFKVTRKIAASHKERLGATGLRIIVNQGIPGVHLHILHFHIHIIPRYEIDHGKYVNEGTGNEITQEDERDLVAKLKLD